MFHISRAIYRDLADEILERDAAGGCWANHHRVLAACESTVERMVTDRHYFARPARTLFNDIRVYFPMSSQERVYRVVSPTSTRRTSGSRRCRDRATTPTATRCSAAPPRARAHRASACRCRTTVTARRISIW